MKNKLYMYIILLFSAFMYKSNAFGGDAHFTITQSAYLRTCILDKFDSEERKDLEVTIIKGCNIPDEEESSYIYKSHFYNIMPNIASKIEDILTTDDNAEKRMYQHYRKGIEFYRTGNRIGMFDELGRSLHYMEDMCCPVHLLGWGSIKHNWFDIGKFKRIHDIYEEEMNKKCGKFLYKLIGNDEPSDFKKVYTLKGIVNTYPLKAYHYYESLHQTEPTYEVFKNAHEASCELIYLFFKEVGIEL